MATDNEHMIAALKREREGYVVRRLPDRVRQVDEALEALGANVAVAEKRTRQRKAVPEG